MTPNTNRYQGIQEVEHTITKDDRSVISEAYTTKDEYSINSMSSDEGCKPKLTVRDHIAKADLIPITSHVTSIDVDTFQEKKRMC